MKEVFTNIETASNTIINPNDINDYVVPRTFVNTSLFSPEANYYNKYGRYPDGEYLSYEWEDYWTEQTRRCEEGYSVGGVRISGRHYFFLNFAPIEQVYKSNLNGREFSDKKLGFPRFWDEHYNLFHIVDIAKYGIDIETYNNLRLDVQVRSDCLSGGKHFIWLKPRGVGASFVGASISVQELLLSRNTKVFTLAIDKETLTKDGILDKAVVMKDFINSYKTTSDKIEPGSHGFFRNLYDSDKSNMTYRVGRKVGNTVIGRNNWLMGITLGDSLQKARGKRGKFIHFEELGKFKGARAAWRIGRSSVEEGQNVYGTLMGWGTGGSDMESFADLEHMTYNPDVYNAIAIHNKWDEGAQGTFISYFTSCIKDIGFIDKDGNSDTDKAEKHYRKELKKAESGNDNTEVLRAKSEKPFCPRDACLNTKENPFLKPELIEHLLQVQEKLKHRKPYIPVSLSWNNKNEVLRKALSDVNPIFTYPIDKSNKANLKGTPIIFDPPYKNKEGSIPKDLYIAVIDPFQKDEYSEFTDPSLGVVYILEVPNNFTKTKGNRIVASYVGRGTKDEFNAELFKLAALYNAKIGIETNAGDVVGYAAKHKKLFMLERAFNMGYLEGKQSIKNGYGIHITTKLKNDGILYLRDWLYTPVALDEEGKSILTLHTIEDLGLLQELSKYNDLGNFDRISAMIIAMYYMKELDYNERVPKQVRNLELENLLNRGFDYNSETSYANRFNNNSNLFSKSLQNI